MHAMPDSRAPGTAAALPGAVSPIDPLHVDTMRGDFIPHPDQFPLRYRRRSTLPWRHDEPEAGGADVGVSFHSPRHLPAGTRIELEIPLRGVTQRFVGTVVMVREESEGYQIGLWFANRDDAARARIVERICHTECYLQARRQLSA